MDFQQSNTFSNLLKAFESELITASKYKIYSTKAKEDGYIELGNIYDQLSGYEIEHAIGWLRLLNGGVLPDTLKNLEESYESEKNEAEDTYRKYASVAREEGYDSIAMLFDGVANIEMYHDTILKSYSDDMENNTLFCKRKSVLWICMICGNILGGNCAPEICPICGYPQNYYQVYDDNP